jgi:hypothetical protein
MSESSAEQVKSGSQTARRPYEKPSRTVYGNVEEMTRGTSGSKKEGGPGAKPRP